MNRMRIDAGQRDTVIGFIRQNALKMLKEGGGVFAHPFIDPGAGYDYNLWDWDSYWSSSSLFSLCEYSKIKGEDNLHLCEKILRHAKGNILNFLDLLQEDGFLAMVTTKEGLFSHFLVDEHRAGKPVNQHKPFLAQSILRVSDVMGRTDWFPFEKLLRYLDFYFSNQYDTESGLFFWRNDIMIGIDNNPTVFGRPDDSVADVFLNSFLYLELKAAAELAERVKSSRAIQLKERAEHLGLAIKEHLYDERDAFFYSGDLLSKTHRDDVFHHGLGCFWKVFPMKIRVWSGFLPMICGLTTADENRRILQKNWDEDFLSEFGVRSLAKNEKMYNTEKSSNPSNWLGPIWIIVQYCVFRALLAADRRDLAEDLLARTFRVLALDIEKNGSMSEYYVPETGKPIMHGGFLNWNCLPIAMLLELEK